MQYQVFQLRHADELADCPEFVIENYLWDSIYFPRATGRMGYLPGTGLLLRMECEEADPLRTYTQPHDPVYRDSAMEAFFSFPPQGESPVGKCYLNFEINANGAMLASQGAIRGQRPSITPEDYAATGVRAEIEADRWSVSLCIPESLLEKYCAVSELRSGDVFYCNFYKICESPVLRHFASYRKVESEKPNFHQPQYFASAVITERE